MQKMFLPIVLLVGLSACSSMKDQVISRMDNMDEKPAWATLAKTTYVENGRVYAIGFVESSADAKIQALMKLASHNGKSEISRMVANNIGVVYQSVEEGTSGNELTRYIGTEKSSVLSNEIQVDRTYYEKVLTYNSNKEQVAKIQLYAMVSIPEKTLRDLVKTSLEEQKNISPELRHKVDKQLDKMLEE